MPVRDSRYQAAVLHNDQILLVRHRQLADGRSYWVLPGGGRNPPETEEACIAREVREETHLEVEVLRMLLDEPATDGIYRRWKTFLCRAVGGQPRPGVEPEAEHNTVYEIAETRWWSLRDPESWDASVKSDHQTSTMLRSLRRVLGYE